MALQKNLNIFAKFFGFFWTSVLYWIQQLHVCRDAVAVVCQIQGVGCCGTKIKWFEGGAECESPSPHGHIFRALLWDWSTEDVGDDYLCFGLSSTGFCTINFSSAPFSFPQLIYLPLKHRHGVPPPLFAGHILQVDQVWVSLATVTLQNWPQNWFLKLLSNDRSLGVQDL